MKLAQSVALKRAVVLFTKIASVLRIVLTGSPHLAGPVQSANQSRRKGDWIMTTARGIMTGGVECIGENETLEEGRGR